MPDRACSLLDQIDHSLTIRYLLIVRQLGYQQKTDQRKLQDQPQPFPVVIRLLLGNEQVFEHSVNQIIFKQQFINRQEKSPIDFFIFLIAGQTRGGNGRLILKVPISQRRLNPLPKIQPL